MAAGSGTHVFSVDQESERVKMLKSLDETKAGVKGLGELNQSIDLPAVFFFFDGSSSRLNIDWYSGKEKEVVETSLNVKRRLPTAKDQTLEIVGSCNGLLCFLLKTRLPEDRFEATVCVYNPLTCEYIEILDTCAGRDGGFFSTKFGFGCSKYTDQYKVFSFLPEEDRMFFGSIIQGHVFTVGVDCRWREYEVQSVQVDFTRSKYSLLFNGVLHWVGGIDITPGTNVIYAFDLEEEKCVIIHLPPPLNIFNNDPMLGILNDHLCAVVGEEDCSCVWMMKDYGVVESWTKYIVVKEHNFLLYPAFVCIVAEEEEVEEDMDSRIFMILDRQSRCRALPYVPYFSLLKDVVKGVNLRVRKI
ncbi:F-box protein At3g07870-like [Henckelia pumila]|uniref:F-box protein At3g07870-like n=1 Tax=Henckelia pumila TaxID=405737 RepID=UPI003C6DE19A